MPAQKRSLDAPPSPPPPPPPPPEDEKLDDSAAENSDNHDTENENGEDSDGSCDSSSDEEEDYDEYVTVKLGEIRKEVQCPICLGIIRKTRTVMECLHRFCRECIDKSMRLGNNECPACRTHCASRRSLRDDPNYDALIAALYPDIDKYEEEELAFHEEDQARNKQIQASIAQTFRRQTEALGKKRASAKVTAAAIIRRQGTYRSLRGRRSQRVVENQGSDDDEGANGHDYGSSGDEVKPKRYKRWARSRSLQPGDADVGYDENDSEAKREIQGGIVGSPEILTWGRGGTRSYNRYGGPNWSNGKLSRNSRASKLVYGIRGSDEYDAKLMVNLTLVSLHGEKMPSLQRPYLYCNLATSVRQLSQYVAMQTSMEVYEIEMLVVKDGHPPTNNPSSCKNELVVNPHDNEVQVLTENQTLGELHANFTEQSLVLAYRKKVQSSGTDDNEVKMVSPLVQGTDDNEVKMVTPLVQGTDDNEVKMVTPLVEGN